MGVRIRQWPAQLASRALATLHLVAASGREGQVKPDRLFRGFSQNMLASSIRHASEEAAAIDPAPALTDRLQGRRHHRGSTDTTSSFSADAARGIPTTRARNIPALAA
jgi:hypothetical protein